MKRFIILIFLIHASGIFADSGILDAYIETWLCSRKHFRLNKAQRRLTKPAACFCRPSPWKHVIPVRMEGA